MSTVQDIIEKGKAGYPAIFLQTSEDTRSTSELKKAAKELNRKLFIWTYGSGLIEDKKGATTIADTETADAVLKFILDKKNSTTGDEVYQLRLFSHWMEEPIVQSRLLDIIPFFKSTKRMLVITSPTVKLPPEVEKEFALVESVLPTAAELMPVLDGIINGSGLKGDMVPNTERREMLMKAALGLTTSEAENALTLSIVRPRVTKSPDIWNPKIVLEEKCHALKKTGLLEYIDVSADGLAQVGGLEVLKDWVRKRKRAFSEEAKAFGLPPPCGILLVGPAGCGKSLTAKAVSGELGLPLLRLDMGKMFGSLVGQSEANMRQAIQIAEAVSPCILWIDEIEKGLAGSTGGSLDSGVGARVLGTILTWMQEKKSPVFVYATANDVTSLPPELLRKGRFDEIFSVALPNQSERKAILSIHLARRNRAHLVTQGKIDINGLSGPYSDHFTGAEIESVVKDALYSAFEAGREIESEDIRKAFEVTKPLAVVMPEKIEAIKRWCENRTRSANAPEPGVRVPVKGGRAIDTQ
jgi:AAA+ superfamily predicted ATPase